MLKGLRKRLAIIFTAFTGTVLAAVLVVSFYFTTQQTVRDSELWFSSTVERVMETVATNAIAGVPTSMYTGQYQVYAYADGQPLSGFVMGQVYDVEPLDAAPLVTAEATAEISPEGEALFTEVKRLAEADDLASWVVEGHQIAYMRAISVDGAEGDVLHYDESGPRYSLFDMMDETQVSVAGNTDSTGTPAYLPEQQMATGMADSISITVQPVVGTEGVFTLQHANTSYRATYFSWTGWREQGSPEVYEVAILEDLSGQTGKILLTGLLYFGLLLAGLALLFLANWFLAKLVLHPTTEGMRRQTEFVAAASHELRSPLAVIRASLSAAEAAADAKEAEKYQTAAAEEAERMSHLVDDMLLLAGGDAGSWQLEQAPVDMDTLLIDAAEVYRPLAKQGGVSLVLQLPDEALPKVQGDVERLRQILAVLLDNALQYAPKGTDITISAAQKKGRVRIRVADQGCGIPDEEKERVFQRFYRADSSRHEKCHFGLGLAVAKELAELHGGSLMVRDTKGGGATFVLELGG